MTAKPAKAASMQILNRHSWKYAALGALSVFAVHGAMAPAQVVQSHNSNAPVDVAADRIELQDRADRVVLSGGVQVTQAGLTIRSARMTVAYSGAGAVEINRIDATGGVTITKDDLRATGGTAIYDLDARLITLIGDVQLVQGANRLNGGRVTIDLNNGRSAISGSANAGGQRRRHGGSRNVRQSGSNGRARDGPVYGPATQLTRDQLAATGV